MVVDELHGIDGDSFGKPAHLDNFRDAIIKSILTIGFNKSKTGADLPENVNSCDDAHGGLVSIRRRDRCIYHLVAMLLEVLAPEEGHLMEQFVGMFGGVVGHLLDGGW
mmetsp:Transcript_12283/g.18486  ORF Transcript_12283/g.18486 Transcript_12283/m.18486 type:complete len:108 (+) Transcript_12283:163-486(+)